MDGDPKHLGARFTIPISLANGGARSGTVVSMELEVHNPKTNDTQRFYGAYLGEHPKMQTTANVRQFTPMTILGQSPMYSEIRTAASLQWPVTKLARIRQKLPTEAPTKRLIHGPSGDYNFHQARSCKAPPTDDGVAWEPTSPQCGGTMDIVDSLQGRMPRRHRMTPHQRCRGTLTEQSSIGDAERVFVKPSFDQHGCRSDCTSLANPLPASTTKSRQRE